MVAVIGVVGEKRAGKDTFVAFFQSSVLNVSVVTFSDILFETLSLWGIEPTRHNLQQLPIVMDHTFGEGSLTRAVQKRIENSQADFVLLSGIRWWSDYRLLRSFENNRLVYVTADIRLRWERARAGGGKAGESSMSFEEFCESDTVETEIDVPQIGAQADITIENNLNLRIFKEKCRRVVIGITSSFPS